MANNNIVPPFVPANEDPGEAKNPQVPAAVQPPVNESFQYKTRSRSRPAHSDN